MKRDLGVSSLFLVTIIVPLSEEAIKLAIARWFRNGKFRRPSYFFFFAVESVFKVSTVYAHCLALGASNALAIFGTASVVVGASSFHVYSSALYSHSQRPSFAFLVCLIIHVLLNLVALLLPPLSFSLYVTVPWLFSSISGIIIWAYFFLENRLLSLEG